MKKVRILKRLKSQLKVSKSDAEVLKIELSNKQREYQAKKREVYSLHEKIKEFEEDSTVTVSEHALLRYFERVLGYDLENIKQIILAEDVLKLVDVLGDSGSYPNKDFKVVMKNGTVTTIIK